MYLSLGKLMASHELMVPVFIIYYFIHVKNEQ